MTDEFVTLPVATLRESPLNPRKTFGEHAMADLERSIAEVGKVLVPLLVRPVGACENGWARDGEFEILAGARRFRVATKLGLAEVPCRVLDGLSDSQALEIMVIENLQRADVHPLEEADGYRGLIASANYTVEQVAQKIGKSISYVYQRLKLIDLSASAKKAFLDGTITAGHAILLARVDSKTQKEILDTDDMMSVRELGNHIQRHYHNDLEDAPWPLGDGTLVLAAGACNVCPKRLGADLLDESDDAPKSRCVDKACFERKCDAWIKRREKELTTDENGILLRVAVGFGPRQDDDALDSWSYKRIEKPEDRCESARPALVVAGELKSLGATFDVCANRNCPKHGSKHASARGAADDAKARELRKRENEQREAAAETLRATMKRVLAKVVWPLPKGVIQLALDTLAGCSPGKKQLGERELALKLVEQIAGDYKSKWFWHQAQSNKEIPALAKLYGVKLDDDEALAKPATKPAVSKPKSSKPVVKPAKPKTAKSAKRTAVAATS